MRVLLGVIMAMVAFLTAAAAQGVTFGAAGVPRDLGATRDYERIFAALEAAGITSFYPTFQYVEAPEPKSLGFETDFMPPCTPEQPSFAAMRKHKVRLIALGAQLMPADGADDGGAALRALIACAGRETIEAVMSFDEPAHQRVPVLASARLYRTVKAIDPTLPVMMVHAPFVLDRADLETPEGRRNYLRAVTDHSRYADIVGFDVYPVPKALAQVGSPILQGDAPVDHATAVRDHATWLARAFPAKRRFMVLQAFSYADQYDPASLAALAGSPLLGIVRPPTLVELQDMVKASVDAGATQVVWWGQSFQKRAGDRLWRDVLSATAAVARNRK